MAIFLVFVAAVFVSLSNLSLRRSVDAGGSVSGTGQLEGVPTVRFWLDHWDC